MVFTCQSKSWSEPAATNAPVADEPIEAVFWMNENPISLPAYIFFSHLFSTPKFSPLLPTTYQPLPPPHSITRAPEMSSGSELGAGELGIGAWNSELGARERLELERDPRGSRSGTHVSILLFFVSFILFVCLWSCFTA